MRVIPYRIKLKLGPNQRYQRQCNYANELKLKYVDDGSLNINRNQ